MNTIPLIFLRSRSGLPVVLGLITLIVTPWAWSNGIIEQKLDLVDLDQQILKENESQRKQWDLSEAEWTRYQDLMQGIRGSISPTNISPIEVLGTHARSDQERQKYAELWARMRHDDASRILAFQKAYFDAWQKLYPDEKMIDVSKLKRESAKPTSARIAENDRLLVFVKVKQCLECQNLIQRLLHNPAYLDNQIDLYFTDTKPTQDDHIRSWAKAQNIDIARVKSGKLTLNHDHGDYFKLTKEVVGKMPQVFKFDGKTLQPIRL